MATNGLSSPVPIGDASTKIMVTNAAMTTGDNNFETTSAIFVEFFIHAVNCWCYKNL